MVSPLIWTKTQFFDPPENSKKTGKLDKNECFRRVWKTVPSNWQQKTFFFKDKILVLR